MAGSRSAGDCRAVLKGERRSRCAATRRRRGRRQGPRPRAARHHHRRPRGRSAVPAPAAMAAGDGPCPGRAALRHLPRRDAAGDRPGAAAHAGARSRACRAWGGQARALCRRPVGDRRRRLSRIMGLSWRPGRGTSLEPGRAAMSSRPIRECIKRDEPLHGPCRPYRLRCRGAHGRSVLQQHPGLRRRPALRHLHRARPARAGGGRRPGAGQDPRWAGS